jgi:thiamine biosynthesis lipoprotein
MHTRVDMLLCNCPEGDAKKLAALVFDEIIRIEKTGNCFDPESEISRVNRLAPHEFVTISAGLYDIIDKCIAYNKKTLGYFDVTVGSQHHNPGFISLISLDAGTQSVSFRHKTLKINLSGFLKGYALDRIKNILLEHAVFDALINIGNSSVMALGNHPYGEGWKVSGNSPGAETVVLCNECFTTSGNHSPDRKHIIDPRTGNYVEGRRTVSVVTGGGSAGEALSTALFAAPAGLQQKIMGNFNPRAFFSEE